MVTRQPGSGLAVSQPSRRFLAASATRKSPSAAAARAASARTTAEGWKFVRWGLPEEDGVLEPRRAVRLALLQLEAVRTALGRGHRTFLEIGPSASLVRYIDEILAAEHVAGTAIGTLKRDAPAMRQE